MADSQLNQAILQALAAPKTYMQTGLSNDIAAQTWTPNPNDLRPDGTLKQNGYFGVLKRPDGGVSTEISIGLPVNGQETTVPALVPTLNSDEVKFLLSMPMGSPVPHAIARKAADFATQRIALGLSPFASNKDIPFAIKQ